MNERPKFFDDLAGVAGGAISALSGLRDEAEALIRAQIDEAIRRLDLVRRDEVQAALDMAAAARTGQDAAEVMLAALTARLDALEARLDALADGPAQSGGEPGMIG
jgi:BMFP domain-containing protein YqiC